MVTLGGLALIVGAMVISGLLVHRRRPINEWAGVAVVGAAAGVALVLIDRFGVPAVPLEAPPGEPAAAVAAPATAPGPAGEAASSADTAALEALRRKVEAELARLAAARGAPARVQPAAAPLDPSRKLAEVDDAVGRANAAVASLRDITELMELVVAAQDDDRGAYDRLDRLARDAAFRYHDMAGSVRRTVALDHGRRELTVDGSKIPWRPGVDPRRLGASELRTIFAGLTAEQKPNFLDYLSQRGDLSRKQRLGFLADVIRKDGSLRVVECAGRYFAQEAGLPHKPLGVGFYLDWWDSNQRGL